MAVQGVAAARAIDALRRGWPVMIDDGDARLTVIAAETAALRDGSILADRLIISAARAATLNILNQRAAADASAPALIELAEPIDAGQAMVIGDPAQDMRHPLKGPFRAIPFEARTIAQTAMELARHAGLLPAFMLIENRPDTLPELTSVTVGDVAAYADSSHLHIAARAHLPVAMDNGAEIVAFRSLAEPSEHIALILGERDNSLPLVRLHSECLTGDVLGSLKCDCGPQLAAAVGEIAGAQWGVLLYLRQEGRAIGLINKLRAYQLQDQGFDTVEANNRLGFATDARDFSIAARMLEQLNIVKIRLMTNNPDKVAELEAGGISVAERLPLIVPDNPHNRHYIATKRQRTGHML